jgi:cytochrome P450
MTQNTASKIQSENLASGEFKPRAYEYYARLREEAPVFRLGRLGNKSNAWLITRYEDVSRLLKSDQLVKDRHNAMTQAQLKKRASVQVF